ncbi:hypothetical protein [Maritimibacter sp. HL-12]|uniref:hypothetical protein n=1 Tax=Maritimibacter sp. HL-12 TaxID=1162418 RepID=UPI000A0EFF14|nr:hypothetical protein [Maritimibacter sp. HL-12]SMH48653.1 hypothetical protein SAMN05661107_2037 [Maritimibacter sp. HL-12]
MRKPVWLFGGVALFLAACEGTGGSGGPSGAFIQELPEGVLAIAAPYQDLAAVKIDPADGCYVYRHEGPVETTFLPLRAKNGRPICSAGPAEATG